MLGFSKNKKSKEKKDKQIIIHQVNCKGVMGAGFAKQVKDKYPQLFKNYRERCMMFDYTELLGTNYYYEDENIIIVNMFSQNNYGTEARQTNYEAMAACLDKIRKMYPTQTIVAPYRIGCGLGGGDWNIVSKLLEKYNIETSSDIKL